MGWIDQPEIDRLVDEGAGDSDAVFMRWEFGRCEALEELCVCEAEVDKVWQTCRVRAQPTAAH